MLIAGCELMEKITVAEPKLMYRIDIALDPEKGYAALLFDATGEGRMKGLKGNSVKQLLSRISGVVIEEEGKRKHFPLESEPSRIITNGF